MTPAEKIELWDAINAVVVASGGNPSNTSVARQKAVVRVERSIGKLLALAEAVPVLLATVSEGDRRWMSGPMVEAVDRLAAAWAAMGDG